MPPKKNSRQSWQQQTLSNFVNPNSKSVSVTMLDCDDDAEVMDKSTIQ
jgi:hypothetical protein